MNQKRALAAAAALNQAFDAFIEPSPPELLFLGPIFQEAITHTRLFAARSTDPEAKLVANATRDALQRVLTERQALVAQPLGWSYEIRALLHSCVAGQGSSPSAGGGW